jgi:hypothetical protein
MSQSTHASTEHIQATEPPPQIPASIQGVARWKRITVTAAGFFAVSVLLLGAYWSLQPETFDVRAAAAERTGGGSERLAPGVVTVASVTQVSRTLIDKPGGYLYNDVTVPGIYLDNMPSWEYGLLKEVRDSIRSLRNDFSRSQTQSVENGDLRRADQFVNYRVDAWILPTTESQLRQGVESLEGFLDQLLVGDPSARFFVRADNLAAYLAVVEKRLGSYAQRLSASVGDRELTATLVPESEPTEPASEAPEARSKTPRIEVDNVFHEARGYAWGLLHTFNALAIDFEPVLRDKNAEVSMQQVIRDLEEATKRMWSPMVLNGHGFGYVANHSLVLASYISRANAAVLDLRILLQQG